MMTTSPAGIKFATTGCDMDINVIKLVFHLIALLLSFVSLWQFLLLLGSQLQNHRANHQNLLAPLTI